MSERRQDWRSVVVRKVQEYIKTNLDKRLSLSDVASVFGFSENYLSSLFSKYGDVGFVEYTTEVKMDKAKEMMRQGNYKVYEIADSLGFESAFYFSKVFKKHEDFLRGITCKSSMGGKLMTRMHDYHLPKPDVLDEDRQFVVSQAEASLGQPYPSLPLSLYLAYTQSGDRAEFEARYFSRRQMLSTFVLAETLERKGRFLPAVMDGIWAILEESTWCLPAHNLRERDAAALPFPDPLDPIIDLFAAESGATLSVAATLLGDELPSVVKERIEREVHERIVRPYLTKDFWWMARGRDPRPVNWSPWCTQNVLLSVF